MCSPLSISVSHSNLFSFLNRLIHPEGLFHPTPQQKSPAVVGNCKIMSLHVSSWTRIIITSINNVCDCFTCLQRIYQKQTKPGTGVQLYIVFILLSPLIFIIGKTLQHITCSHVMTHLTWSQIKWNVFKYKYPWRIQIQLQIFLKAKIYKYTEKYFKYCSNKFYIHDNNIITM